MTVITRLPCSARTLLPHHRPSSIKTAATRERQRGVCAPSCPEGISKSHPRETCREKRCGSVSTTSQSQRYPRESRMFAIRATKPKSLRVYEKKRPGVDCHCQTESSFPHRAKKSALWVHEMSSNSKNGLILCIFNPRSQSQIKERSAASLGQLL